MPTVAPVVPRATERLALHPLGLDRVRLTGGVWGEWQRANREVTTPHALRWLEQDGAVDALRRPVPGAERRSLWFSDSDVHKVLEGISWDLALDPVALGGPADELVAVVTAAQQDDGYLNSFVQQGRGARWDDLSTSHEMYCIGHLVQAGVAHARSTGSSALLDVARRAADRLVADFGGRRRDQADGHPEVEMALVELYRQTGERSYLDLAGQLLDVRGTGATSTGGRFDAAYYQDATPVREQTTVVGHAVRALYLLAGVVDVHLETGEPALLAAALRQWDSLEATKTHLTGAVGARFEGEAFGDEHELPPDLVYGETCASIAVVMLAWRLLLATGQGRFADAIERALHNLVAASTAVGRDRFFYNNPEQRRVALPAAPTGARPSRAEAPGTRPVWFECACCPPNVIRTVASLGAYVATAAADGVQVHQYLPAVVDATVASGEVSLRVETDYPVTGAVDITVERGTGRPWALALRVPAWSRSTTLEVDGERLDAAAAADGYVRITRTWRAGDAVRLVLDVAPRLTVPHPAVDALRGSAAVERGPLVYCFESPDQADGVDLNAVELVAGAPLVEDPVADLLGQQVVRVRAEGRRRDAAAWAGRAWARYDEAPEGPEGAGEPVDLVAVPYHLWANRGPSVMRVFVPLAPG